MTTTTKEINWFEFGSSKGSGKGSKKGKGSGSGSKNGTGGSGSFKGGGKGSGKGSGGPTKDPAWIKGRLTLDADNNDSETDSVNGGFDEGAANNAAPIALVALVVAALM